MSPQTDLSGLLARHIASVRYEDLPQDVVDVTKRSILDGIGVIIGASGAAPECRPFAQLASAYTGADQATVLGYGRFAAAAEAAFANGAMSHALDFEDAHVTAPVHANAAAIPAVLALAEAHALSGRQMITAIAVGCDIASRLGLAVGNSPAARGWYPPPILSTQGAVAAAANLLGLGEQQVRDASSIAAMQIAPSFEIVNGERSVLRSVREAFCARAAVTSVQLAQAGVAGGPQPIDGRHGLLPMFAGEQWDPEAVSGELGVRYEGLRTSFKLWPSCRGTHVFIAGVLDIVAETASGPADISAVRLTGGPIARMLCEPQERKRSPQTAIDAKFSIPFTVATALVHGEVGLGSFTEERLHDPAVLAMAQKIDCLIEDSRSEGPARVVLELTDGRECVREVSQVPGDPGIGLQPGALEAKFSQCASLAAVPLAAGAPDRIISLLNSLESVQDIRSELSPLLAAPIAGGDA